MSRNRLVEATSPYLLQHQHNPVHWWSWGPEALAEAKRTNRPILLSVGYAACHWCHVMAHESFEDEPTAAVMNELFVNIKVDREERPDVDAIYMAALHQLGEQGGWPLTMFLTPDARPFWGGTYFPKESRFGKPAFVSVLHAVARTFRDQPDKVTLNAEAITGALDADRRDGTTLDIDDTVLANVALRLVTILDPENGGTRGAPKFPQWSLFWLLWRAGVRYSLPSCKTGVTNFLTHVSQGGIYDHLGGGFARYSVDERWLAPHFEKMLYDNALLLQLMSEVWRETKDPLLELRARETVAWLTREMVAEGGGFAASLDADSEGEEGKFYVWSAAEIASVLGSADAKVFAAVYDVSADGNWEGHTILNRLGSIELKSADEEWKLAQMRAKLLQARSERVRPAWDDKVLADWNGLAIAALVHAGRTFKEAGWIEGAAKAFEFIETKMSKYGRLLHSWRAGRAQAPATSADYANMIQAALALFQHCGERRYLERAESWTAVLARHYWLAERQCYAFSADDTSDVIVRMAGGHDDAVPNANGTMVANLSALHLLTGKIEYREHAVQLLHSFSGQIAANLFGHTGLLAAAFDLIAPQQVIAVGTGAERLVSALNGISMPGAVQMALGSMAQVPADSPLSGKEATDGKPTAYVCVGTACSPPATEAAELLELVRRTRLVARTASDGQG